MKFMTNSGLLRLVADAFPFAYQSDDLTNAQKEQYKAIMYAVRGSDTMIHEAEWCKRNLETVADGGAPTVPILFFISKPQAEVQFPRNPEKYLALSRNFTDNQAEYIEMDCEHCIHVFEPEFIADEIRRFADIL